ncbi:MAG TPA: ribulose-phosphate 3-epimerase [Dehalococcoidia bacterium]|nr:ribulose-phosphate 3-epimerase [Dehalococcoidia bacterium]
MTAVKLAPSILTADFGRIADQIAAAEAGGADYLHLDVMDGHFVPPITFGPLVVEAVRKATSLPIDLHLMIEDPEAQFDAFAEAGADIINFHIEATHHADRLLRRIHAMRKRAGICINPATPLSAIEEVLAVADQVMVMMINPGWGGQKLLPAMLDKVCRLKQMLDERGLSPDIEVDGGVKPNNAARCIEAGARVLVCGSSVFNSEASPRENLRDLRRACDQVTL